MNAKDLIELLGKAFTDGDIDTLAPHLADDCEYVSDYAQKTVSGAEQIISRMKSVSSNIDDSCRYSYSIVQLSAVLAKGISINKLDTIENVHPCEYGMLLYQYGAISPVAVVVAMLSEGNDIKGIILSRKKELFNVKFYAEEIEEDSALDLPSTVIPLTSHERKVKELQNSFSGQHLQNKQKNSNENFYIWRKADEFIKVWLKKQGYAVLESKIFNDCIGYRCNRNNYAYTIYMYAYGKNRTSQLDGDYCSRLKDYTFSEKSTVLVVCLNVKRFVNGSGISYRIYNYCGSEDHEPELWRLTEVNGKSILEFYPRKEMIDATYKMMYAFNRDCMDVYDCIIAYHNPVYIGPDKSGHMMNSAFFSALQQIHEKYGDMKIGYVRYNDVIYSSVPYIEDFGFFSFRVDNATDRIVEVTGYPFDGGERKVAEFIKTNIRESEALYSHVPNLVDTVALDPVATERFALKLYYDNGECKKYVLPIESKNEEDEVVSYQHHVFTDKIWKSAIAIPHYTKTSSVFPNRGPAIKFKNEFCISTMQCYEEGTFYSEPILCNEVIYKDSERKIKRLWKWNVNSLHEDKETGLFKVLISGRAFNYYGVSVFASSIGKRLISLDFDYIDDFHEGLARVCISGNGYGYVDENMRFVIPMKYDNAEEFKNGKAKVKRGDTWCFIDKAGCETPLIPSVSTEKYQEIGDYSEGLCKVSTLKIRLVGLAYYSDYDEIAGTWGYVNEKGQEVISPQYIYAYDFSGGMAIVCKGKWTIDKKWDNKYNTNRYWTEEELWGAIDPTGKEVIPCIFDEIKFFWDTEEVFMAHFGGWENGHWGVIDKNGNWLAEPIFEDIDYPYRDGLFAFYAKDKWSDPDDVPLGIYDIKQKNVIFEPQFYDVSFRDDDLILVEVDDTELGRRIEKLINRSGNESFRSNYTSIYAWKEPYEVVIRDDAGERHGLIDKDGTILLPCKYDAAWNGISYEQKIILFKKDGKQGIIDFDDRIIVEPKYYEIYNVNRPLLTVRVGEKDHYKEGLITHDGKEIIPAIYDHISWCKDNKIICCLAGQCEVLQLD